ncbi:hypothetical protein [Synechococcus sp. PCC 7336]|uniref:hypothetical protein n=1 Tax=Synechococcus sp. PCC 7336 TaxID=195250 RepID=UPI0003465187|nr:hypothetical protein [Synechococcus sp. PCC 7336]
MPRKSANKQPKKVETLKHEEATRKHIPMAEYRAVMEEEKKSTIQVAHDRRKRALAPRQTDRLTITQEMKLC